MEEEKSVVVNSIIGHRSSYSGDVHSVDLLRIDGNFSGVARSDDAILVGQNGRAKGTLISPRIIIAGVFQGKVENCDLVILQANSIIIGDINVKKVIIESGAIIKGKIRTLQYQNKTIEFDEDNNELSTTEPKQTQEIRYVRKFSTAMLEKLFDS